MAKLDPRLAKKKARTALRFIQATTFRDADWQSGEPWPHRNDLAIALDHCQELAAMVLNLAERVPNR